MMHLMRVSRISQHFIAFVVNFAHGGFVALGVMVVGLIGYQLTHFGTDGINPRVLFGHPAQQIAEAPEAGSDEVVDAVYAESATEDGKLTPGLARVANTIARRYKVSPLVVESLVRAAQREGKANNIDPLLILAVITVESSFNPFAESVFGAQGLMQIIPKYHTEKIDSDKGATALFDPAENIRVGTLILREYLRLTGNMASALQVYGGASSDPDMSYSTKVFGELHRLRQVAGAPSSTRTAERSERPAANQG